LSGIVGIFRRRGVVVERAILQSLTDSLQYRGPDGVEVWSDGRSVGFGHTMLRTTRQSAGEHQPTSLEERLWITADARIDCRAELVEELEQANRGVGLAATDPELILHAYDCWREQCVLHLRGDFAFAIWDAPRKRLFCARDHLGIKPFFYSAKEGVFLFSNTLNCLRMHPEISDDLNEAAVGDFLLFGLNCDIATTTFRDIQRLPPAHCLTVSASELRTERYWSPPIDGRIRYDKAEDYIEHFDKILQAAVADRLRTDRVGILLSGGLDSSAVAATARGLSESPAGAKQLRAYTKVFESLLSDDEGMYASKTADFLKIPMELMNLDDLQPFDRWETNSPEPIDAPFFAGLMDHYSKIASGCRVVLSGDGADNLMCFQMWPYARDLLRGREWRTFFAEMAHFLRVRPFPWRGIRSRFRELIGRDRATRQFPNFIASDFANRFNLTKRWEDGYARGGSRHLSRPKAYASITSPLVTQVHELNDPGVTHCALEFRYPFCDLRIINFLLSIPPFPWCFQKRIMREMLRGRVPDIVRTRPKTPFRGSSFVEILQRRDSDWAASVVAADQIERYVNPSSMAGFPEERDSDVARVKVRPYCLNFWLQSCRLRYNLQVGCRHE
jgi:asparagine synthase (glutamine-hydrolysing)